ncbi:hypothetical protein D9M68_977260 [compost metagenome]
MLAPRKRISTPASSGPILAPTPKVTSNIAVSETRISPSTWSLAKATASGYRLNNNKLTTKPTPININKDASGISAKGSAANTNNAAHPRINQARS